MHQRVDGYFVEDGPLFFAWARFAYDGPEACRLVDSDVNPLGGPITVGEHWNPIPEPTAGTLVMLGLAALALRRRRAC